MMEKLLDKDLKKITKAIVEINNKGLSKHKISGFGMKLKVIEIIEDLKAGFFPSIYEKDLENEEFIEVCVRDRLTSSAIKLNSLMREVFLNICEEERKDKGNCDKCKKKADDITATFMNSLVAIRDVLHTDIEAAYNGDPAARSLEEILLSYPCIEAITIQRLAHELFKLNVPLIPRIMTEYAHSNTGIDIHPGAKIGKYFFIDHATGVVIGETCVIGNNVKIYQGVTLGAKSFEVDEKGNPIKGGKRHPNIEDDVIIYSGATILGGSTTIGRGSIIGGSTWIIDSVPPYSRVYNTAPSQVIKTKA